MTDANPPGPADPVSDANPYAAPQFYDPAELTSRSIVAWRRVGRIGGLLMFLSLCWATIGLVQQRGDYAWAAAGFITGLAAAIVSAVVVFVLVNRARRERMQARRAAAAEQHPVR